ncbi:7-carboxy-7-deazaguanine synthase QueE [Pseudomarimonas arenosa]|uniref:7-carboxy-7-deazaguanine synthase n=1 Tax=Pseudomarimonas arenosa TaxID=2774145 RepID=A0AAW3ZD11_9GAMM|nr:7-carboxy-7-deazaguanine synthase QueE [Pseudomarimonas arenosa]MBD8524148.1 7-carboxy-7-deazaguanine synthase QueE [Pseudomarimonas arenosa]
MSTLETNHEPRITNPGAATQRLKITEIFHSLQGESRSVGWPTVFVRLTGCPLRCTYCDTTYSFYGGEWREIDDIVAEVQSYAARHVCVTGGEPLSQKRCLLLLSKLCDLGLDVSLETSGALDIAPVDPRVVRVVDLKTPSSGELARNLWSNIEHLKADDQVKFVIGGREDYEWSREVIRQHNLPARCEVLISPSFGVQPPEQLAEWMLEDRLDARLQLQLHKILWGEAKGR